MDRLELKQHLQAGGVREDRYLLVGLDPPRAVEEGACIVRPNQHSWEVLVWAPVKSHVSLTFSNEDEACEYVLNTLIVMPERTRQVGAAQDAGLLNGQPLARQVPVVVDEGLVSPGTSGTGR
jgi:hypothetical protein